VRWGVVALILVGLFVAARAVWRGSDQLADELLTPRDPPLAFDLMVLAADDLSVTLTRTPLSQSDGVWGLQAPDGYGQLGAILMVGENEVRRDHSLVAGEITTGDLAAMDPMAYPPDGAIGGIDVRQVTVTGANGEYPAWFVPGSSTTWIIFVHGQGIEERHQVHRLLPLFTDLGYPVLAITYRNDTVAPAAANGLYGWGLEEWEDLDAAAQYARLNGAEDWVVFGNGMGATIGSMYLHESPLASGTRGMVFDSPVLDLGQIATETAREDGLPRLLTGAAKALAALRFDIRWSQLDQVDRAADFTVPVLILHGESDGFAPIGVSEEFAAARPDLVRLESFNGASHLASWNQDPERYEEAIREFLAGLDASGA